MSPSASTTPLATLAWTVDEWRASAVAAVRDKDPGRHLNLLTALVASLATAPANPIWIHVPTRDEISAQWHAALKQLGSSVDAAPALFGVPVAVKDNIDVAGMPTTAACKGFRYLPTSHAGTVEQLVGNGAIIAGKTNLDQFATGLVGTRSPSYGAVPNAFRSANTLPTRISGGSSSGSAVAVAHGLVPLSLGTDTAGSGRVPAGFNNLIGLKPTKGLFSTRGVVPACRTLDCVSVFAMTLHDANTALKVLAQYDGADPYARRATWAPATAKAKVRIAVPKEPVFASPPSTPDGGAMYRAMYDRACRQLAQVCGAEIVQVDFAPLHDLAACLYEGTWVAERWAAVGEYVEKKGEDMDPTVLKIVRGAQKFSAADAFTYEYKAAALRRTISDAFSSFDAVLVPTTPMPPPTMGDIAAEPVGINSQLGTYTNFVNLADWCGLAIPGGFCAGHEPGVDGKAVLPFGLTLLAPAFHDKNLLTLASQWLQALNDGHRLLGATSRTATPALDQVTEVLVRPPPLGAPIPPATVRLAVVGAHLAGMPLHHELERVHARFVAKTRTAPCYKLYALAGTKPAKPGLFRVTDGTGAAIRIEVYDVPVTEFGHFMLGVPPPLGIGSVECDGGHWVKSFICEPFALDGAADVTRYGGWRAYLASLGVVAPSAVPLFRSVLVANRGEIAVRAIKTFRKLGIRSVAVFSDVDRYAPHVVDADAAVHLPGTAAKDTYLNVPALIDAARKSGAEAVFPGYGFVSESPEFVDACDAAGIAFIGPTAAQMRAFAHKHTARELAQRAEVPLVPGSALLSNLAEALRVASFIGYPVMLKSTAGGGGIGLQRCNKVDELRDAFDKVKRLGEAYFGDAGVFLEKCIANARHIEVQIIGDGRGHVLTLAERDCSLQRRHQKVVEEAPAPQLAKETRRALAQCAASLAASVQYRGAGTVEFIYDVNTNKFYFLEVNARLQVEHPVTEAIVGVDLIEWMTRIAAGDDMEAAFDVVRAHLGDSAALAMPDGTVAAVNPAAAPDGGTTAGPNGASIEVRVYAEDPAHEFRPSPGKITQVQWPMHGDQDAHVRIDTWIAAGTEVSPHYDPMLAKIIVHGTDRADALQRMLAALDQTHIEGVTTNVDYLRAVVVSDMFRDASFTTHSLDSFSYVFPGIEVLSPGTSTTIQDFPGRVGYWAVGVPPSGPMDAYAHRMANAAVGNRAGAPALECTLQGPTLKFGVAVTVAVTGAPVRVTVDKQDVPIWTPIALEAGQVLAVGVPASGGCRTYVAVRGGIHAMPVLGSAATFALAETGGHQGRVLRAGDLIVLESDDANTPDSWIDREPEAIHADAIPSYTPANGVWQLAVMVGPHAAPDYLTPKGLDAFLASEFTVGHNANRLGVRLSGPKPDWARTDGGEAGLHPSNVLDCPYAIGSVNLTGDFPTILTQDGPSLGGFVCPVTIVQADLWKVGQLRPGDRLKFKLVSFDQAIALQHAHDAAVGVRERPAAAKSLFADEMWDTQIKDEAVSKDPVVWQRAAQGAAHPRTVCRQAGDRALLLEYGEDKLDLALRFRVQALIDALMASPLAHTLGGPITELIPGVRSLQILFDGHAMPQRDLVAHVAAVEAALKPVTSVPSRIVHLPLAFDDESCKQAVARYAQTVRATAPWLPDNVEFLRRINGLNSRDQVEQTVFDATYMVLGLGDVYYGAPCAVPLDPRHRLLSTKYNPARTFTAEGTVGIGGVFMCIYGISSPGGYQLVGRTLPIWNTVLAANPDPNDESAFAGEPWLVKFFDQVRFFKVSDEELARLRADFAHNQYTPQVEDTTFDFAAYQAAMARDAAAINAFQTAQAVAFRDEVARWSKDDDVDAVEPAHASNAKQVEVPPGGTAVQAGFASRTWKVLVEVGQVVAEGVPVVMVEAMKAELPVPAPCCGVVVEVLCAPGQVLDPSDVVVVLGPPDE
ncbi:hypothetical protein GGF32_008239 [Allomyces javanicus]|nr:hypothetical protein GGF32_008239 [Allomyces javanicus]